MQKCTYVTPECGTKKPKKTQKQSKKNKQLCCIVILNPSRAQVKETKPQNTKKQQNRRAKTKQAKKQKKQNHCFDNKNRRNVKKNTEKTANDK